MIAPERREENVYSTGVTTVSDEVVSYASWLLRYMADSIENYDNYDADNDYIGDGFEYNQYDELQLEENFIYLGCFDVYKAKI